MYRLLVLTPLVMFACSRDREAPGKSSDKPAAVADPCSKAKPHGPLAWIADDYASAIACARHKQVPLVLDLWAPWCHTCLSMQSTVLVDKAFEADGKRFVFASLDTDRDNNAAAVAKFPPGAWPTFYVISPDEVVLARFVGAASVAQFKAFLDAGVRALAGGGVGADGHLLAAERAIASKDPAKGEAELEAAIAKAPAGWSRQPDALVTLIQLKSKRKDHAGCVTLAETWLDKTGTAASASDFLTYATGCADELVKTEPERVQKLRERAVARWKQLTGDPAAQLSVDDRSDALANLRSTYEALGKPTEAKATAEAQRALLDEAAAKAGNPMAASTYNWHRAEVYVYLQRPLELVPALQKSVADLPDDYDPPARLGWVYWKAGKLDEAAKATERAIKLAYGPRKVRVLNQRSEIAKAQGDKAAETQYRQEIVKTLKALPPSQTSSDAIASAEKAVVELQTPDPGMPAPASK
ncbi:MAG: thioredoxin family protein [Kofleriaceae bacterium]